MFKNKNAIKRMRSTNDQRSPDMNTVDARTLFPYKITDEGLIVHVDLHFFRDLQERLELTGQDYVRIEATQEGIELTPVRIGPPTAAYARPYRVRLDEKLSTDRDTETD